MSPRLGPVLVLGLLLPLAGCLGPSEERPPVVQPRVYLQDCIMAPGAGGATWPEPCLALASPNDSPSKAEVDLAVNPTNPRNVVVASKDRDPTASDCVWSVAQATKDGGRTWTTSYVGGDKAHRAPAATGYQCVTDPIMAFDAHGVLYYSMQAYQDNPRTVPLPSVPYLGTPSPGSAMVLARSKDGGLSWDKYNVQVLGDGYLVFHDYQRMLVNPKTGSVHTIWNALRDFGSPPVDPTPSYVAATVVTSRDGGETVDPPVFIGPRDASVTTQFFSGFAATKDGTIYVTVNKGQNSDAGEATDVWIYKSTDDARTFTEVGKAFQIHPTKRQYTEEHKFRTAPFVEMAIDDSNGPHAGRVYLFWPEWNGKDSDILSSWSDDGAKTWSTWVNVAERPERDQLFMRPAVGPDGRVHVLFTTTAYSGNNLLDQVHAWSEDGGTTWHNDRLTTLPYDGDKGIHQDGFPFIGDYNGLRIDPQGLVHAAWADTVTGRAEVVYARLLPPKT